MATVRYYEEFLANNPGVARQQSWTTFLPSIKSPPVADIAEIVSCGRPFRLERGHVGEHMDYHVADIALDTSNQAWVLYDTGAQLSRPEVTEKLSLLGDVHELYWDTHANNILRSARGGRTRLALDILERRTWPRDSVNLLDELRVFDVTDNARAAAMAVLELRSGFRLTTDWLDSVHDVIIFEWNPQP